MSVENVVEALGLKGEVVKGEFWSTCPSHEDKKPSWSIRLHGDKRGLHSCFSCGFKGNLPQLVAHVRKCGEFEAAVWIAEHDQGEPPRPAPMRIVITRPPGAVTRPPPLEVCLDPLEEWPSQARDYLIGRGVTPAQVERWGIGYAVEGRLAGRVVIPIRDATGWASYTARDFTGQATRRYLYPPSGESDSTAMFGEEHWPADKEFKVLVVVEGAMDALAVERVTSIVRTGGDPWYVAALGGGSSFRLEHARRIATWGRVIVATDPDAAGDKMAKRIKAAIGRHSIVFRCRLMEGTDAASTPPELLERWLLAAKAY